MEWQQRRGRTPDVSAPLSIRIRHARRIAQLTQAELARRIGVGPSAVAQWELPEGTSPTVDHLIKIAALCGTAFEWLSTGRGSVTSGEQDVPAVSGSGLALDELEDRLLMAFRRIPARKRSHLVRWMEDFF
ncbi:helix-turn-helix transcriptional regulator [Lysobacter rhizosphaerae]